MNAKASGLLKADGRHHGIIGYTPLLDIKGFDFQRSFIPDYLHSICLGVIKYLMMIWINGKKTDSWFISKNQMDILVIRMQQIKPPHEISRSQFNLKKIGQWKANQSRAFALYFYPVLDGILPQLIICIFVPCRTPFIYSCKRARKRRLSGKLFLFAKAL